MLEGEFNCLEENTEKRKTFSVLITKELKRIGTKWRRNYKNHTLQITIH